jgi:SAM-dependent methyltransferase
VSEPGVLVSDRNLTEIEASEGGSCQIRARSCPTCYLCGAVGTLLYENLTDRLYAAPGTWNFKRCPNPSCGLIWLDPMPIESDIGNAYRNYYTHAPRPASPQMSGIQRTKALLARAYDFGWRFTTVYSERQELELMYLGGQPAGRVLEIGCGDGQSLAQLRARGWDVQGQEVDENAADRARRTFGVTVFCGRLDQAGFRNGEFDAVVMSHVIEHVHDPFGLMREAKRVLKREGHLISITPNTHGWGHARFGTRWYGLDPPRHLFLFSRNTLEHMARACGFQEVKTWTTAARSVWIVGGSLRVERGEAVRGTWALINKAVRQAVLHAQAVMARRRDPNAGDECVLSARS